MQFKGRAQNATVSCAADTQFRTATILLLAAASVSAAKRKLLVRLRVLYEFQYLCDFICISFNLQFDLSEIWTNLKFYFRCFANFSTLIEVGNTAATAAQCCCSTMRVCVWVCVSCVCVCFWGHLAAAFGLCLPRCLHSVAACLTLATGPGALFNLLSNGDRLQKSCSISGECTRPPLPASCFGRLAFQCKK